MVTAIARTKNEQDIVEAFVRHTCAHVDLLIVQDNSEDETPSILAALKHEGLPLQIRQEHGVGDVQAANATSLMHEVAMASDWVVPLDADEFIDCGGLLKDTLVQQPTELPLLITWRTYPYRKGQAGFAPLSMPEHLITEAAEWTKVIVPKQVALKRDLCKGAHFVPGIDARRLEGVYLAHYPVRSADQISLKATIHNLQEAVTHWVHRKPIVESGITSTLVSAGKFTEHDLERMASHYFAVPPPGWEPKTVHAPLNYLGGPLKYTTKQAQFVPTLLKFAEKMALALGATR